MARKNLHEKTRIHDHAQTGDRIHCSNRIGFLHSSRRASWCFGKKLDWDPVKEEVTNDAAALAGIKGTYREPWNLKNFVD